MRKNLGIYLFLILAIIALYISKKNYKNFSLDKSIRACIAVQVSKNKDMKAEDARKYCEEEIKVKK
tara:strand:- start:124 stop:321 length:198 start_codon:yes stop_codon:yes gene_type:complete